MPVAMLSLVTQIEKWAIFNCVFSANLKCRTLPLQCFFFKKFKHEIPILFLNDTSGIPGVLLDKTKVVSGTVSLGVCK